MVKSTPGDICKPGGKEGLLLPFSDGEREVSTAIRGPIYAFALVYCFIGVAMIADIFVSAIEAVTSVRKKTVKHGRPMTAKVWNETVSNLSLMALGSSAPEIFLSFIELCKNSMFIGDLGPSTIVGSASFNLLVIIAVCMVAIPTGEIRYIKELNAFYITAAFSLFAYLWLVWILVWSSPDVIDLWEAAVTFCFLPILIWVSYLSDIGSIREAWGIRFLLSRGAEEEAGEVSGAVIRLDHDKLHLNRPSEETTVDVVVSRNEFRKAVSCAYHTERFGAVPDYDYVEAEGTLDFSIGVSELTIQLQILPNANCKVSREFLLIVEDAGEAGENQGSERGETETAEFDPTQDGGSESAILTVSISPSEIAPSCCDRIVNMDMIRFGLSDWVDQIKSSVIVNGSLEEQAEASCYDWAWHIFTVPWQLFFCTLVPPNSFFSGWLCFFSSLVFIAVITAFISDLAELIGCVLQVPDVCTAITFVALGTSMPDLFASLSAATADPFADASIVNVTGSNSVNVFLGLGGPWTLGAIYWAMQKRADNNEWLSRYPEVAGKSQYKDICVFVVQSRNLGFSVLIFTMACIVAIAQIIARRKLCGCELGGPVNAKWAAFVSFIAMWIGYVYLVSWRVLRYEDMDMTEQMLMGGSVCSVEFCIACVPIFILVQHWRKTRAEAAAKEAERAACFEYLEKKTTSLDGSSSKDSGFQVIEKGVPRRQVSSDTQNSYDFVAGTGSRVESGLLTVPEALKEDEVLKPNGNSLLVEPPGPHDRLRMQAASFEDLQFPTEHETPPIAYGSRPQMITTCRTPTPRSGGAAVVDTHVFTQCCDR